MKHVSPLEVTRQGRAKGPTRRALAKQQTRAKVLAAARKLFSEHGYQGATIRDIAAAAGMSTGAVFANFSDKTDLFRDIVSADLEQLIALMREGASRGKTVEDALLRLFMAGYGFYRDQMPLARAALVAIWSEEDEGISAASRERLGLVPRLIADQLARGIERGELRQECDLKLRAQMLFEMFLANFRPAVFESWTVEAVQARARDQIRVLLSGARR